MKKSSIFKNQKVRRFHLRLYDREKNEYAPMTILYEYGEDIKYPSNYPFPLVPPEVVNLGSFLTNDSKLTVLIDEQVKQRTIMEYGG